ncbi:MAG: DUF4389 domain-containing protein [Pseudomonadota bacterium]
MTEQSDDDGFLKRDSMGERFFYSIVLLVLYAVAETLLWAMAVGQFVWMLINQGKPNDNVAEFGARLGVWVKRAAMYLSATTDEKPFPWREID